LESFVCVHFRIADMSRANVFFAALLLCVCVATGDAVETSQIEKVRSKGVLEAEDLAVIDDFIAQAVNEFIATTDFTGVARIRTLIISYSTSNQQSAAVQYAAQFFESARRHITAAIETARNIEDSGRRFKVTLNLLILIDGLGDIRLLDPAISFLNSDNPVIRYWAIRCITNPEVVGKLAVQQAGDSQLIDRIMTRLQELLDTASPEELAVMVRFCEELDNKQAEQLLLRIADLRISCYENWTVKYELLDITVLKALSAAIPTGGAADPEPARKFAQLYSHVMQRYIKGLARPGLLSDQQKHRLASVLVEIENKCLGRLLEIRQSVIKKAVEEGNLESLKHEYTRLFGDETAAGEIAGKLGFAYQASGGGDRLSPLPLGEPTGQ